MLYMRPQLFKLTRPAVRESNEIYLIYIATHPLKELNEENRNKKTNYVERKWLKTFKKSPY